MLPDMRYFGTLSDALQRAYDDPTARADGAYVNLMSTAALTKIAAAQQDILSAVLDENAELRERVEALELSKPRTQASASGAARGA